MHGCLTGSDCAREKTNLPVNGSSDSQAIFPEIYLPVIYFPWLEMRGISGNLQEHAEDRAPDAAWALWMGTLRKVAVDFFTMTAKDDEKKYF